VRIRFENIRYFILYFLTDVQEVLLTLLTTATFKCVSRIPSQSDTSWLKSPLVGYFFSEQHNKANGLRVTGPGCAIIHKLDAWCSALIIVSKSSLIKI